MRYACRPLSTREHFITRLKRQRRPPPSIRASLSGGFSYRRQTVALTRQQLHTFARQGAAARLAELQAEMASIRRAFPGTGTASSGSRRPTVGAGRKRRGMSAAARKAVSARMKKYWAAKRKANAGAKK
jgi:hypothetical protein